MEQLMTINEAAKILQINYEKCRRLVKAGTIKSSLVGKQHRITPAHIEEYMKKNEYKPVNIYEVENMVDPKNRRNDTKGGSMYLKLRQERLKYNWTQEYVANKVGVTKTTIHYIETGKQRPSYSVLVKLEDLFKLNHCQLFAVVDDTHNLSEK